MTTKFQKRRNKLIEFLETIRDDKFNIDTMLLPKDATLENDCGTVSCALGWCPIIFPKSVGRVHTITSFIGSESYTVPDFDNKGNRNVAQAAADFFGIKESDAWRIFYATFSSTPTPKKRTAIDVANDLRTVEEIK